MCTAYSNKPTFVQVPALTGSTKLFEIQLPRRADRRQSTRMRSAVSKAES
jgi:hypothetical protein